MIKKILMTLEGKTFFVRDIDSDFHTQFGFINKADFKKNKAVTNKGKEVFIFNPSFIDVYKKIKRAPQIIPRKDIGPIILETGINKKSFVVDAGSGSGALCCFLANIAKKVISYELRADFFEIAQKNKTLLQLKNLTLKNKDIYTGIDEKNIDLITLDLPEPWKAVAHASKALKPGGFLVSYSPTIPQVMDFVQEVKKNPSLIYKKTIEVIERRWEIEERKVRPTTQQIGHSGFISFVRRI